MHAAPIPGTQAARPRTGAWRFPALLLLALAALLALTRVGFGGDVLEYTVSAAARCMRCISSATRCRRPCRSS